MANKERKHIYRYRKSSLIYKLDQNYEHQSSITGVSFQHERFTLSAEGLIVVNKGYAWNGCSPKFSFFTMIFGTPEGDIHPEKEVPRTYYASLVHDVLYQFSGDITATGQLARKDVDREFYKLLKAHQFLPAFIYYLAVRTFGGLFWDGSG